ncbi:hypothetical protein [Gracilibacillus saliphilus]|uniref:hypothetical protein n=1 Tax=Gracilibacillus saliphilus TaxID=543890 RepID=UPI0013D02F1F|nr:hypothetical protein [Gracilibacillus saliphilus]
MSKNLLNYLTDFIQSNRLKIKIELDSNFKGLAKYDTTDNKIVVNKDYATTEKAKVYKLPVNLYALLIVCHEIGHFLDEERQSIQKEIGTLLEKINHGKYSVDVENKILDLNNTLENNAWKYGKPYVPDDLIATYDLINVKNKEVTNINMLRKVLRFKYNDKEIELTKKIKELSDDNKKLRNKNIELMTENYNLKFGKELDI